VAANMGEIGCCEVMPHANPFDAPRGGCNKSRLIYPPLTADAIVGDPKKLMVDLLDRSKADLAKMQGSADRRWVVSFLVER